MWPNEICFSKPYRPHIFNLGVAALCSHLCRRFYPIIGSSYNVIIFVMLIPSQVFFSYCLTCLMAANKENLDVVQPVKSHCQGEQPLKPDSEAFFGWNKSSFSWTFWCDNLSQLSQQVSPWCCGTLKLLK